MKERSLIERIVAILGVLAGTVVWVVRLLFSLLMGILKGKSQTDEQDSTASAAGRDLGARGETLVHDVRERGQHLLDEAREKGQHLLGDAREKGEDLFDEARERVDDVRNNGDTQDAEATTDTHFTAAGMTPDADTRVSSTQHEDLGGVSPMGDVAAASLSSMDAVYDEQYAGSIDDESKERPEGIQNLDEPGDSDDVGMYGSESGSLMDEDRDTGYAGQVRSESDIGIDRGDSDSELADSGQHAEGRYRDDVAEDDAEAIPDTEPHEVGFDSMWVEDQVDVASEDERTTDDDEVPAASRGWEEPEDDVLKGDPLYGDFESSGTGGEVDLRNDEADDGGAAAMHIVDSPDEPFIEDESATESLGFVSTGTDAPFETGMGDPIDVDEIGDQETSVSEDSLAADALGRPAGDESGSGDLGPERSEAGVIRDPDASRPDGDVLGAYDGSGVDEFADDSVASDMLGDVTDDQERDESGSDQSGERESGSGSVAWATTAGVIDPDLAKPMSSDELQAPTETDTSVDAEGEPGTTEEDAGLRDVASDIAEELDRETGGDEVGSSGTSMSGAGQSAGAMTSDDAANDERGEDEMTADTGSFETGGTVDPDATEEDEEGDTEGGSSASMGVGSGTSFDDVLPEGAYQDSVGYESLQVDEGEMRGGISGDDPLIVTTSATGPTGMTDVPERSERDGKKRSAPAGAVRGDGSATCPSDYPIKGNASSKIYHRPGDSSYPNTIPEFCFATEADAKTAGFRPRKR